VQSAFIKGSTLVHLISIAAMNPPVSGVPPNEQLKIKLEIDTEPIEGADYEMKYRLSPVPYSVRVFDLPSLFAGKLHALLFRAWTSRSKGRDFYDYVWYLSRNTPLNLRYLEAHMRKSGQLNAAVHLTREMLLDLLDKSFSDVNFEQVKDDVRPFIKDDKALDLWSKDFFMAISREHLPVGNIIQK
jgi:hypothetical protein